ncbi:neural cell adhesion molecule L1-like [Montipora foliosa]|uniref:neural cell adhesion molecule L1-like n=1 Tax=Montipora foliosa TaxID=591990 RepID=UPI0035F15F74
MMKRVSFILLSGFIFYLSAHSVYGSLLFLHGSLVAFEGSTAEFVCQETEGRLSTKISWSFSNASNDIVISDNGELVSGLKKDKFKLLKSGNRLEIANITVNDTGNYRCIIRGENGEVLLSASALMTVKARNGSSNATLQQLVPSTRPKLSDIIAPSPAYYTPVLMPRTAYPETAYLSMKGNTTATAIVRDDTSPCGNASNNTADLAFIKDKMSPDLITVYEGEQLILRCAFCAVSLNATTLSWYKEGLLISNGSRHVIANDELGIPVVDHREDEGLYECTVTSRNHSISRYITVIVRKDEPHPMLSSVLAKNQSYLSVRVVWRLTDHGVFTSALVSLSLRLLDSKNWSLVTSDNFQEHGLHEFDHLQPGSVYLLNVSLHNKHKEIESKALVFWSAATNCTEIESETLILYLVNNGKALGVALGIVGLLGMMLVMYACLAWSPNEKRGYSFPPGQQKNGAIEENESLFSNSSSMYYNRAFDDDGMDWIKDDEILS